MVPQWKLQLFHAVFVSELLTAIKIRTGERGGDAIIDDKAWGMKDRFKEGSGMFYIIGYTQY